MTSTDSLPDRNTPLGPVTLREATRVWARIGLLSFGGPAGQIALMHRELVEERKWISDGRFLHALNYCMLLPGPEAQQLATYIGWLLHRTWGGLIAGGLFVLPGYLTILALSLVYGSYGHVPAISAIFFGLKAAVLAVVLEAVIRIGRRALKTSLLVSIAVAAFLAIHFFEVPFPAIVVAAAVTGMILAGLGTGLLPLPKISTGEGHSAYVIDDLIQRNGLPHIVPHKARTIGTVALWLGLWAAPIVVCLATVGPDHVFTKLGIFFSKAAAVTFGGAYAVLAYVAQQAVEVHGWLTPGEMLDGLALAETTPGPLIMVVEFVGYLAAFRLGGAPDSIVSGIIGATIVTWVTFAPCFLWIFAGAPFIERLIGNRWLHAALSCVTAAVVGVILNLSVWFTVHALFGQVDEREIGPLHLMVPTISSLSAASLVIAAGSAIALLRFHVGVVRTLLGAAGAGAMWQLVIV